MKIKQIHLLSTQSLQTIQQATLEVFLLVRVLVRTHTTRVELGIHDETAFLPLELAEQSLRCPVDSRGVDLVVAVLLEDVDDG